MQDKGKKNVANIKECKVWKERYKRRLRKKIWRHKDKEILFSDLTEVLQNEPVGLLGLQRTEKTVKKHKIAGKINGFFASVFTTVGAGKKCLHHSYSLQLIWYRGIKKREAKQELNLLSLQYKIYSAIVIVTGHHFQHSLYYYAGLHGSILTFLFRWEEEIFTVFTVFSSEINFIKFSMFILNNIKKNVSKHKVSVYAKFFWLKLITNKCIVIFFLIVDASKCWV